MDYPALKFSYRKLSALLELVGRTVRTMEFQKICFGKADTVAIDGHSIPGRSEDNGLVASVFKTRSIGNEYMNLMEVLDTD